MRESEFHDWLKKAVPPADGVSIGIGDDAAVLETRGRIAVASDILVEGVHFRMDELTPGEIGAKAVNRNFSDMAAMGLHPHWILVSAAIPEIQPASFVQELVMGIVNAAKRFNAGVVGGDTSTSLHGLVLDVAVMGRISDLEPVVRSGALPGHRILVTGELGGSASGKHIHFTPRLKEGEFLNRYHTPSAMIDISDGLAIDLSRILDASHVGAVVEAGRIPLSAAALDLAKVSGKSPTSHAMADGEDFELLFTLPPEAARLLVQDAGLFFKVTDLGEIVADPTTRILRSIEGDKPLGREGYDHRI